MASNPLQLRAARYLRGLTIAIALVLGCCALPLQAQVDLSGSWVSPNTEDVMERAAGPLPGDWTGMPLSDAGRALALSYLSGMLSEPERICQLYNQWELADGPWNLRIWSVNDPATRTVIAWVISGAESRAPMTIWMDGRPQPSEYAPHDRGGFTTGSWSGDELTAYTTHMKETQIRRNGAFNSDEATMTSTFILHGELLTAVYIMNDPVYLTQPYIYARSYLRSARPVGMDWDPCIVGYEGVNEGEVPFYLPGKNPLVDQMMQVYHIPEEASLGGAQTMYPAFRDKLKAQYLRLYGNFPKKCTLYCTTEFRPPAPPRPRPPP